MDDERHKEEFEEVRKECPFGLRFPSVLSSVPQKCKALSGWNQDCEQKNCAIFYFKNFFARRT